MKKYLTISIHYIYTNFIKKILFLIDPLTIHNFMISAGETSANIPLLPKIIGKVFRYENPILEQNIHGINFSNPVGLSAGFDKDGQLTKIMDKVGFGFMSVGSLTHKPYEGNAKPWLYRLPKSKSILVNYGLKNDGIEKFLIKNNDNKKINLPLFISIAKTNCIETVSTEEGIKDYCESLKLLKNSSVGNVYELNISCPNAFGGEAFTTPEKLESLLLEITTLGLEKPIFIKMPINLDWEEFKKLLDVCLKYKIAGVIIGNLNKVRSEKYIFDTIPEDLKGNLSGKPTYELSNHLISETYKYCGKNLFIVGVGGIFSPEDAYEKIKRGASLVQLITGMIFEGPALISIINRELVNLLKNDCYSHISEAVGAYYKAKTD